MIYRDLSSNDLSDVLTPIYVNTYSCKQFILIFLFCNNRFIGLNLVRRQIIAYKLFRNVPITYVDIKIEHVLGQACVFAKYHSVPKVIIFRYFLKDLEKYETKNLFHTLYLKNEAH